VIYVTRRYRFSASHRLHAPSLSESENREIYGKCNNPYGHGHNYLLEVSAMGPVEARTGSAVNVGALDKLVANHILEAFDQHNLNAEVAAFASLVPTAENIALEVEKTLREHWEAAFSGQWPRLAKVRIYETRRNSVELAAGNQTE